MPTRSITRRPTLPGGYVATSGAAPIFVDSDDNSLQIVPAGSGSTAVVIGLSASTSGFRSAAGTGVLVTGAVTVATGLSTVLSFQTTLAGTGATATGATEVDTLLVSSITTGAVVVQGAYHSGTAAVQVASVSGTATFYWLALGT